ncbi:MAG: hypothetical protein WC521_03520 [Bdellovibrionales bacterium]
MENFAPLNIVEEFARDPSMGEIFSELYKSGTFSINDVTPETEQAAYDSVVAAQAKFEQGIVNGLKSGEIVLAIAVVHTGGPCNPLSYKNNNRTPILEAILENGGVVACVYQNKNELGKPSRMKEKDYAAATERYQAYLKKYPNLQDYPVEDEKNELTQELSGASYLVRTKEGKEYFYSFQSFQIQTIGKSATPRKWAVWAGPSTYFPTTLDALDEVEPRESIINWFLVCETRATMRLMRNSVTRDTVEDYIRQNLSPIDPRQIHNTHDR